MGISGRFWLALSVAFFWFALSVTFFLTLPRGLRKVFIVATSINSNRRPAIIIGARFDSGSPMANIKRMRINKMKNAAATA
jgi:hypothetical protein